MTYIPDPNNPNFFDSDGVYDDKPYVFKEKPAAKSSTFVMQVIVCQKCRHKFDGKIGGNGEPCNCKCHEGRI